MIGEESRRPIVAPPGTNRYREGPPYDHPRFVTLLGLFSCGVAIILVQAADATDLKAWKHLRVSDTISGQRG